MGEESEGAQPAPSISTEYQERLRRVIADEAKALEAASKALQRIEANASSGFDFLLTLEKAAKLELAEPTTNDAAKSFFFAYISQIERVIAQIKGQPLESHKYNA